MSKHAVRGGDVAGLAGALFVSQGESPQLERGGAFRSCIQEAGLDGFWIYRMLKAEGIESYVVDPASVAISRQAPASEDR